MLTKILEKLPCVIHFLGNATNLEVINYFPNQDLSRIIFPWSGVPEKKPIRSYIPCFLKGAAAILPKGGF